MKSIFRKTALDQISSPDQLDQVVVITPPFFWVAMLGAGVILIVGVLWSIFGRIPVNVKASGICMSEGGIHVLYSAENGMIDEVSLRDGDRVQEGDVIARMTTTLLSGQTEQLEFRADMSGKVMGLDVAPGNVIGVGSTVCRILDDSTDHMTAILYVPVSDGRKIRAGMEVKIYPTTVNSQEYGHIKAVVDSVDNYVTSTGEMNNMLGDSSLVESFSSMGPVIEIKCSLTPDSTTASGYEWSNRKGAQVELAPGTTVTADIMIEKKAPITILFPLLDEKLKGNT
jgi:multidrug efflux pump subunit AcrA (membrane-fusion protein)